MSYKPCINYEICKNYCTWKCKKCTYNAKETKDHFVEKGNEYEENKS